MDQVDKAGMKGDVKNKRQKVMDCLWLLNNRKIFIRSLKHLPQYLEIILNQGTEFYELTKET